MHILIAAVTATTLWASQDAKPEYLPASDQPEVVFELYTSDNCTPCAYLKKALKDAGLLREDAADSCIEVLQVERTPSGGFLPDGRRYSRSTVPVILCPLKPNGSREIITAPQTGDTTWVRTVASLKRRYTTQIDEFNDAREAQRKRTEAPKAGASSVPQGTAVAIVESTDDKITGAIQGLEKHLSFVSQGASNQSRVGALLDIEIDVPDEIPEQVSAFLKTRRYKSGNLSVEWPFSTSLTLEGSRLKFSAPLKITYDSVIDVRAELHSIEISADGKRYTLDLQGRVLNVPDLVLVLR